MEWLHGMRTEPAGRATQLRSSAGPAVSCRRRENRPNRNDGFEGHRKTSAVAFLSGHPIGSTQNYAAAPPEIYPARKKELQASIERKHRTSVAIVALFQLSPEATLPDQVNLYSGQVPTVLDDPACLSRTGSSSVCQCVLMIAATTAAMVTEVSMVKGAPNGTARAWRARGTSPTAIAARYSQGDRPAGLLSALKLSQAPSRRPPSSHPGQVTSAGSDVGCRAVS